MKRSIGAVAAGALLLLAAAAPETGPEPSRGDFQERTGARAYRVGLRIEPTRDAEPGRCLGVGPDDLRVTLRGDRLEPSSVRVERVPRATIHALLVDTSYSMLGDLTAVRRAATGYLDSLDLARDRAMLISFDENVVLAQPPTTERARLVEALDGLRLGASTSLNDALVLTFHELESHPERPVVLLLTDGVGLSGLYDRDDVFDMLGRRSDLVVFSIGFGVPPLSRMGPTGVNSARRYLQRMARRSNGRFFEVPTPGRLRQVYRRIHEALETEAVLTAIDPDPTAPPAKLKVRSLEPGCRARTFPIDRPDSPETTDGPAPDGSVRPGESATPHPLLRRAYLSTGTAWADPECARQADEAGEVEDPERLWWVEDEGELLRVCLLDVTQDPGLLYDPMGDRLMRGGPWMGIKTRSLEIEVPPLSELPRRPEAVLDRLAVRVLEWADAEIERDPMLQPVEWHARPFHDCPELANGMTLHELQRPLARLLQRRSDYGAWLDQRLRAEGEREFEALVAGYRRRFPDLDEARLREAAEISEPGRRARVRAAGPSDRDLRYFLAGWLGDVAAHDLFVRWEREQIDRFLRGLPDHGFVERWRALRERVFVPSYVRSLSLLAPGYDEQAERVGFWRILLPRPGWLDLRRKDWKFPPGVADIPLDLVPDLPLGLWLVERLQTESSETARRLLDGYTVTSLRYSLGAKPGKHDPRRAFRESFVELTLSRTGQADAAIRLQAELKVDPRDDPPAVRLSGLRVEGVGDVPVPRRIADVASRLQRKGTDLFSPRK